MKLSEVKVAQSCLTLCDPMDRMEPARLLCPWNSLAQNTGVSSHFLLQGIFPTQAGIKSRSPSLQVNSLPSDPPGKLIYPEETIIEGEVNQKEKDKYGILTNICGI